MKCYLIAKKLSHSFSKPIHNALASYSYDYKELNENELKDFFEERDFDGLNVTIPYKTTVMEFLDEISPEASKIGAVNTIVKRDGKLYGHNTDYYGFMYMIKESGASLEGKDVVIIGNGGAAKTAFCACEDMGAANVRCLTREDIKKENILKFLDAHIVVNATPVGMYPDTGVAPVDISLFEKCEAVLDVIYNPSQTKLIQDAKKRGIKTVNGLGMLVAQAKKACEIFTGAAVEDVKIEKIKKQIEMQTKNIVLIGMPGCGKSCVGKELASVLGKEFYDCDDEIASLGKTPAELIEQKGEEHFRNVETKVLSELCKKSGSVIATGGGAVTRERNEDIIRQNSIVVFISRNIEKLATEGRPLSQGGNRLKKMYEVRLPLYKRFCDIEVESQKTWQETAKVIIETLNKE